MQLTYLTYILLLLSIISLWLPTHNKIQPWQGLLFIVLLLAIGSKLANFPAVLCIIFFYILMLTYNRCRSNLKLLVWALTFLLGLALELHVVPGFHNLLFLNKVQFTKDAIPFTLYLNIDKSAVGVIIIGLTLTLAHTKYEWKTLFKQTLFCLLLIVPIILALSYILGYIKFELKWPQHFWIWAFDNLFFACLAEEALFRGFFQEPLSQLQYKYAAYIAILIPAIIFGLMHYPGGPKYVVLATSAGILYGWVYKTTKRIEASIIAHFFVNLCHILFFTYPALNLRP
jgi:hypothetical protein